MPIIFSMHSFWLGLHLQGSLDIVTFLNIPFLLITQDSSFDTINDFISLVEDEPVPLVVLLLCAPFLAETQPVCNLINEIIKVYVWNITF